MLQAPDGPLLPVVESLWRGKQAWVLSAPACPLQLMEASALRGCNTGTGRQGLHPLPLARLMQPVAPASLEESAAQRVAALRQPLWHRSVVLSRLLRRALQALELPLMTLRVRHASKCAVLLCVTAVWQQT